jgi:DNA processing protein
MGELSPDNDLPVSAAVPASGGPEDRVPPDAEYWLALSRLPGIGRRSFLKLIEAYGTPRAAWERSDNEWREARLVRAGLETGTHRGKVLAWAGKQVELLSASSWSMSVFGGSGYPPALATLHSPPPFLFISGRVPDMPSIAVVGSRQSTDYGLNTARQMAGDLAAGGVLIVSGFARGIDTAAHVAALDAGGATVAVWGCGPDSVYPRENKALVGRVVELGGILTEFPFGTAPEPQNFPVRNRLIAGLSLGVLVVQARQKSGALLTAQHALEQGKDVYAIPGEIGRPQSAGVNDLLKQGAKVVTCAEDILSDLGLRKADGYSSQPRPERPLPTLTTLERRVFTGLGGSACHIDRLAVSLKLSAAECAAVLLTLELKGIVRQSAGNMFSRLA